MSPMKVLQNPPWKRDEIVGRVLKNVAIPEFEDRMAWVEGEREEWGCADGLEEQSYDRQNYELALASEQQAVALFESWEPSASEWLPVIVARFELAALPGFLRRSARLAMYLGPFASPKLAEVAAIELQSEWDDSRTAAEEWLTRHPEVATLGLIPLALGKGRHREKARMALQFLVLEGYKEQAAVALERFPQRVRELAHPLIEFDDLALLPEKIPRIGRFVAPATLPKIHLRTGGALPESSIEAFLTMLAFPSPPIYAGVMEVCSACTSDSLARFGQALLEFWLDQGGTSKHFWVLRAQAALANRQTVGRLASYTESWSKAKKHKRAGVALEVLGQIGSDLALMHLDRIALKGKSEALRDKASDQLRSAATQRGLAADELADRLVPDLGLSEGGGLHLDYGPRRFAVSFDESLQVIIRDEDGELLRALPKARKSDDADMVESANRRLKSLKTDLKAIAAVQIARWEQGMLKERRWTPQEFQELVLGHSLLVHLGRRMVWGEFEGTKLARSFRICEDGSLADSQDQIVEIGSRQVGLPYPTALTDLDRWRALFEDYRLLQPFPQLQRETHLFSEVTLEQVPERPFEAFRASRLLTRGWLEGDRYDHGRYYHLTKPVGAGHLVIDFRPGIQLGVPIQEQVEQVIRVVALCRTRPQDGPKVEAELPLSELSDIEFSELVSELEFLTT